MFTCLLKIPICPNTIRIDSDQLVKGRVIIFKIIQGTNVYIRTEGSEQIQFMNNPLADTATLGDSNNFHYATLKLFSDGTNWYDITGTGGS